MKALCKRAAVFAALAFGAMTPALADDWGLFGGHTWDSKVIRTDGLPHSDMAVSYRVTPMGQPAGQDPALVSYWIVPCPRNLYASWDTDFRSPNYGRVIRAYAPKVVFDGKSKARLGQDKEPNGENGKFKKLSAAEAAYSCGGQPEIWRWLIADRGAWYAMQVNYQQKATASEDWMNSEEQIAAVLRVTSEDGKYEVEVTQDITTQVKGNCERVVKYLQDFYQRQFDWQRTALSDPRGGMSPYAIMNEYHDRLMKISAKIQVLKSKGLEGGCSPDQIVALHELSGTVLGEARRALTYMMSVDNANAAALDILFNTLLATERCLVRGTIKTFSKILATFPPTTPAYLVVDTVTLGLTGSTMMELAVLWGDARVLETFNGGRQTEGCAANIVGSICRIATDALWNKAQMNRRLDETGGTVTKLDQLNELLRPGRALPPNQSVGVVKGSSKGWGGLSNLAQHKDNWCEGYRQIYFSTFATFYKDYHAVQEHCVGAKAEIPLAFEWVKRGAVLCSNLQRGWKLAYPPRSPPPTSPPAGPPTSPPTGPPTSPPAGPPTSPPAGPPTSPPAGPPTSPPTTPPTRPPTTPPTRPPTKPPTRPPTKPPTRPPTTPPAAPPTIPPTTPPAAPPTTPPTTPITRPPTRPVPIAVPTGQPITPVTTMQTSTLSTAAK